MNEMPVENNLLSGGMGNKLVSSLDRSQSQKGALVSKLS